MWIDVNERLPACGGFYQCKTNRGTECAIPFTRNMRGDWLWLTPGALQVTHWSETDKKQIFHPRSSETYI